MARVGDQDILKYEKRRYAGLDQRLVDQREQALVRRIFKELEWTGQVLDLPCGYGRFSQILAQRSRWVISADVSAAMVSRCRERLGGSGAYVVMDIRKLPLKDASVEGTFTMRLFHHGFAREQMGEILLELARVSRRWVILSYYRQTAFHAFFRRIKGFKSRISMMSDAELEGHARKASLLIRHQHRLIPLLHAQVLVVLGKK